MENEMKPNATMSRSGSNPTTNYINATLGAGARAILKFCEDNYIPVRGHVLVWHGQSPRWFFTSDMSDPSDAIASDNNQVPWASKAQMEARLESYITNLLKLIKENYPRLNLYAYDVVNEAVGECNGIFGARCPGYDFEGAGGVDPTAEGNSPWVKIYGDNSFIESAFKYAAEARDLYFPNMKLFYNDYNEWDEPKRDHIINNILIPLRDKGYLDGMGMQGHVTSNPNDWAGGLAYYKTAMSMYANLGIEVQITEMDVGMNETGYTTQQAQANRYEAVFEHAMEINASNKAANKAGRFTAIIIWGPSDNHSWRSDNPTLHNSSYQPKVAYNTLLNLVPQAQWGNGNEPPCCSDGPGNTEITLTPDANGYYFYHTYENGTTQNWVGHYGASVANTNAQKANGNRSLAVTNRAESWQGAEYDLTGFQTGDEYSFSVLAMYAEGSETSEFKFTLQYDHNGDTRYEQVDLKSAAKNQWIMLENKNFPIPAGATNMKIFVEMPDAPTTNFFIDDAMGGVAGTEAPGREGVTIMPDANDYFFHHTFETAGDVEGWEGRFGPVTVESTAEQKANGNRSLVAKERNEEFNGPAYYLPANTFITGKEYSFSTLAMYAEGPNTSSFKLTLQYNLDGEIIYAKIDSVEAQKGKWVMLENQNFLIPAGATNLILYVEMPGNASSDIYIDDVMGGKAGAEAPGRDGVTTMVASGVVALPTTPAPKFYNLKGVPMGTVKPTVPGVYVEKSGKSVKKIVVR